MKILTAMAGALSAAAVSLTITTALPTAAADQCAGLVNPNPDQIQACQALEQDPNFKLPSAFQSQAGCSNNFGSNLRKCGEPCTGDNQFGEGGVLIHNPPGCDPDAPLPNP